LLCFSYNLNRFGNDRCFLTQCLMHDVIAVSNQVISIDLKTVYCNFTTTCFMLIVFPVLDCTEIVLLAKSFEFFCVDFSYFLSDPPSFSISCKGMTIRLHKPKSFLKHIFNSFLWWYDFSFLRIILLSFFFFRHFFYQ
jgi:hypothetical protein